MCRGFPRLSTHLESRGLYFRHLIRTYVRDWRSHIGETLRWTKITRSSNTSEKPHPSLGSWKSTAFLMHDAYQMVWHTYKKPSLWRNAHLIKSSLVSTLNRQWMVESVVDCRLAWMNVMQCSASQCRYVFRSDQVIHAYRRRHVAIRLSIGMWGSNSTWWFHTECSKSQDRKYKST